MTGKILNMAYHASQNQYSLISSHVKATLANMREPNDPTTWSSGSSKPTWLVAIDYTTIVSLLLVTTISAILLATTAVKAWRGRAIQLDISDKAVEKSLTRKQVLANTLFQNMDHTLFEDGEAVDEVRFWRNVGSERLNVESDKQVRWHKALIIVCVTGSAVFQSYRLAISPGTSGVNAFNLLQIATEAAISFYSVLLLPFYACVRSDRTHSRITYHLSCLASVSALHHYFASQGQSLAINYSLKPHWTEYYSLALACVTSAACVTIGLGPGRYREMSRLYNRAVADKAAERSDIVRANVLGSGGSIIGYLMGSHTTDLAREVASLDQVDLHELPVVPAALQQQPSILKAVAWRKRDPKWLNPTVSLLWEVWGPQWLGWIKGEVSRLHVGHLADRVAYLCLLMEILSSFVPHYCVQQILYILDGHADRRAAWAFTSLWCITRVTEIFGMTLRFWDWQVGRRLRS
jgi:hypothetical protein